MKTPTTLSPTLKKPRRRRKEDFDPLIGPHDVAKWLGVSAGWVRDHATRKTPRLPAIKVGKLLRFRVEDIREFIEFVVNR